MKNLLKSILHLVIKPKLDARKEQLREKLTKEIATTKSEWVKARNTAYLNLLAGADGKVLDIIEKEIDKLK